MELLVDKSPYTLGLKVIIEPCGRRKQHILNKVLDFATEPTLERHDKAHFPPFQNFGREDIPEGDSQDVFARASAQFEIVRKTTSKLCQCFVEKWRARFQCIRHATPIHLHIEVVHEVLAVVNEQ